MELTNYLKREKKLKQNLSKAKEDLDRFYRLNAIDEFITFYNSDSATNSHAEIYFKGTLAHLIKWLKEANKSYKLGLKFSKGK